MSALRKPWASATSLGDTLAGFMPNCTHVSRPGGVASAVHALAAAGLHSEFRPPKFIVNTSNVAHSVSMDGWGDGVTSAGSAQKSQFPY